MEHFGTRLRRSRKLKKLSLDALGKKIGVAKSTIAGYESGFRQPSIEIIVALAKTLNVSTDYLLDHTPSIIPIFHPSGKPACDNTNLDWNGLQLRDDELIEIIRILEQSLNRSRNAATSPMVKEES